MSSVSGCCIDGILSWRVGGGHLGYNATQILTPSLLLSLARTLLTG